jgi:hypothetical protein
MARHERQGNGDRGALSEVHARRESRINGVGANLIWIPNCEGADPITYDAAGRLKAIPGKEETVPF